MILIPGLCDLYELLIPNGLFVWILMKINYMMINLFSPKLFTPIINYIVNLSCEKNMRSSLNSIFYIGVSIVLYIVNYLTNKITNYYFDDLIAPDSFLIKYKALGFFFIL